MRFAMVVAIPLILLACSQPADDTAEKPSEPAAAPAAPDPASAEGKIASAVSAGPVSITAAATVMDMDAEGKMTELRAGTNGWLCMPDNPNTPGPDPMCADKSWQDWFGAYMAKKPPMIKGVGIAYMLAGGSDVSNTDPYAKEPAPGEQFVKTGPHVMVLPPNVALLEGYPTDPNAGMPFVMWKGTPYAHIMVPTTPK